MVTLDGAVINQSGTMSGGGNRVLKGRMSSTMATNVTPQQLSEMEQTLSKEASSHKVLYLTMLYNAAHRCVTQKCMDDKNQLAIFIQDLKNEIDRIEKEIQRNEMDIQV